jgi:ABC-type Fe3+/spermidine/putrescine transport system ATPase subunit
MLYVKITKEEALQLSSRQYGITSGKRNEEGKRETLYFCSNLVFIQNFEREKEFITI